MKRLCTVAICLALIVLVGVCEAQTQLVNDNFDTGINGTYLGPNWTGCGYNNGAYNQLVYQNNEAGGSGFWGQDCSLYTGYGIFPSDQYAIATLVSPNPAGSQQASIQIRTNATPYTNEAYIACGWDAQDFPPDYHYRIWSLAPGTPGPVSLWLSNITPATNDIILCQVLGNTVSMQVNGTTVATVVDTSGLNQGYPGLYYVDPNGGPPSTTDVIFDTFSAGSGPAVVSATITPTSATITAGSYAQFTGVVSYADGSTSNMNNWSSSDTTVATVDNSGFAYGSNPGTVTITGASGADSNTATLTVLAANGYTPLVNDSFVGTGGGYLGSNWIGCGFESGAYSELVYQNNMAGGSGYYSQDCSVYTGFGPFPNDQYATAMVVAPNPNATPEAAIQVRGNATPSTPESYIACGWNAQDFPADYHYRIWSLAPGGNPTSLYLSTVVPAPNDLVWCQVMGTTVNMQVNGTTIATVTDTSGLTSGYPGLYYIDPNGAVPPITDVIFDNFVAGRINGPVLSAITVTPNPAVITAGSNVQFTATGSYTDGSSSNVSSATWSSSNSSIATVSATGFASGVAAGMVTITAVSGTVSGSASLTVNPLLTPTVTFTGAPASAPYNGTFTVVATTNASVMPMITGTAGVCSVGAVTGTPASASAVVTMLAGSGTCTTTATWAASGNYGAAGPLNQTTTATQLAATVTFTGAPASAPYNGTFTVLATTNASVMPTITGTAGVCSVGAVTGTPASASAVVTMLAGTGTCTTTATWAASGNYGAAGPLNQTTTATQLAATVTFTGAPSSAIYNTGFTVTATTNASTMPQITGTTGVCTVGAVSGTPANATAGVTMISGTGTCTLTATWAADSNYSAPAPRTQSSTAAKATSTVTINSNTPNPSTLQQSVTVSFSAAGTGVGPTGSVTVTASTRESCTTTLTSAHNGSCSITFLSAGSRTLSASYLGDNNFSGSTSGNVNQTVNSPTVGLSPSSLNFGTVLRGNSVTLAETVSNTGTGALINLSWTIYSNNSSQFKVSNTTCSSTLNPGSSCVIYVTFKPNSTGPQSGTLRLTDNAPNSPQSVALTGSGR